jgi:hypothetical protein
MAPEPRELPRPHPDVVHQHVRGEAVLVHLRTNRIYALNTTAARLWQLLCEGHDRDEIERRLLEEFDVGVGELTGEIDALLASLEAQGLLTR